MKKLLIIITLAGAVYHSSAQDIFQRKLYAPELALKYREEAGLSADQVEKIKSTYSTGLPAYNNKKWELDAAMAKLEQLIAQSTVDGKAAEAQLDKALSLENEIKKMKLATLIKIKNFLTPAQQAKLDEYRAEPISENSITAWLTDKQIAVVKIREGEPGTKPLYFLVDGNEKKELTEIPKDIYPGDIEKMEVLKGEDALATYGKRGANGVIIITLKKKN